MFEPQKRSGTGYALSREPIGPGGVRLAGLPARLRQGLTQGTGLGRGLPQDRIRTFPWKRGVVTGQTSFANFLIAWSVFLLVERSS